MADWSREVFVLGESPADARNKIETECKRIGLLPRSIRGIQDYMAVDFREIVASRVFERMPVGDRVFLLIEQVKTVRRNVDYVALQFLIETLER